MERPPRKFEDLQVGETRQSQTRTVTVDEIVRFAREYDPQWFHSDPDAARESHFGEVVASGVHVLAIWRQLDHTMNSDIDFVCGIGFDEFRLEHALRPGDTVIARSEVLELKPSSSRNDRGTAITQYFLTNQRGETVLRFRSINLVYRRHSAS
ncbi:MaoC family dehydratase [Sphingomonas daechungensis]|uniref:MaoC family dehydratase N-terminal domain-containing protein n=1 Tax=Sphingomonas daechungensis TaxID=1176646 RepID=A0ABX6SZZ7_9SPHN|nr:MaoC/PaaZ C-terminal domain-containing protein [Sphingomonas daechungensis]QNP42538.1 MaoC family dehydratase N-terminal domain-containing protein [Sphingomonas daechungensis]